MAFSDSTDASDADTGRDDIRILIVDDSAIARRTMRRALEGAGHSVEERESPLGMSVLLLRGEFQVVIIDYDMPDLKGDAVISLIRKNRRLDDVALILVSGTVSDEVVQIGKRVGADGAVSKYRVMQELPNAVRKAHLGRRRMKGT